MTRVRSLVRLKAVTDELRSRALATREIGGPDPLVLAAADTGEGARILLVEDRPSAIDRIGTALSQHHQVTVESDPIAPWCGRRTAGSISPWSASTSKDSTVCACAVSSARWSGPATWR
jgi:hypothetical protein